MKTPKRSVQRLAFGVLAIGLLCGGFLSSVLGQDALKKRKLVIAGGGGLPDSVYEKFLELAGATPRLIVIPTASSREPDEEGLTRLWNERGFKSVEILHTRDQARANDEGFSKPLNEATAVWFGGGSQSKIAEAYCGTLVEKRLFALLDRGGVIGGSSAGAAIQSKVMIASGRTEPTLKVGLGFLPECILDQHFLARDRIRRSMAAVKQQPSKLGIGIDEGTAIVVVNDNVQVLGRSYVMRFAHGKDGFDIRSYEEGEQIPLKSNLSTR